MTLEASPSLVRITAQTIPCPLKKAVPSQDVTGRAERQVESEAYYRLHKGIALQTEVRALVSISTPNFKDLSEDTEIGQLAEWEG